MVIRFNGIEVDRKKRTVSHAGESYIFRNINGGVAFKSFCYFLLGDGVSLAQAFFHVYGDDPDGGPIEGPCYFVIRLAQWQRLFLDRMGLEYRVFIISGVRFYHIVPKYQPMNPNHRHSMRRERGRESLHV